MVGFTAIKRRTRTANPQPKKRAAASSAKRRKRNPDLLTLGALVNPHKKGARKMSKKKGAPKPKKQTTATKHRTPNPQKKRRTKNPAKRAGSASPTTRTMSLLKNGLLALAGLVATRQVPQIVLQGDNAGWLGYVANLLTAFGAAAAAGSVSKGAGTPVMIGGGLYLVDRVLTEKFSSAGQILSLSGMGDAKVAVNGTKGLRGVRQGYFPLPVQYDQAGQPIIPQAIVSAAQSGMVSQASIAAAASGMKGARNRLSGNRLAIA